MHELSIAISILDPVQEECERRNDVVPEPIYVRVGALSGVLAEALASAYDLARENTPFANSRLIIEDVPVIIYCSNCKAERAIHSLQWFCCPECHAPVSEVLSGRELQLRALEFLRHNDEVARNIRARFREAGVFVVSLVSSPGSGKTAFLERTLTLLKDRCRPAALVGDLATENDALRLARSGAPVKQITTRTVCHLEASMVGNRAGRLESRRSRLPVHRKCGQLSLPGFLSIWPKTCAPSCCQSPKVRTSR